LIRNSSEQYGHFGMRILLENAYVLLQVQAGPSKNALSKDIILKFLYRSFLMKEYGIASESMRSCM
jgi:hypothetical protein